MVKEPPGNLQERAEYTALLFGVGARDESVTAHEGASETQSALDKRLARVPTSGSGGASHARASASSSASIRKRVDVSVCGSALATSPDEYLDASAML
jgi:hypothetical protein